MIECKDLLFRYPDYKRNVTPVFEGLDLTIRKGEWVAIVGSNGSGKSTFARLVNGLLKPKKGTIRVFGLNPADDCEVWQVRQKVQMVFQNPENQIVGATVREDLIFGLENLGLSREEIDQRIEWALVQTGLSAYQHEMTEHLSGGQKQRLAIAAALAMKPQILILDEATAMLDLRARRDLLRLIQTLHQEHHITLLTITHHLEETVHCDRVLVFHHGEVVLDGTPADIFSPENELYKYGLSLPPVVHLAHELRKNGVPLSFPIMTEEDLVNALCSL
ncbi:energy-coupling factor transporter ATP-binding protein EcfA1 [Collibacillus ludicampi]|uniref:Energy-coupling factor transporter ATP-binding protein EcfA1 n=1 Tax=Collibacillus ludicampi TaxID=2771369 RepID=A0AAV4LHX7_9BACL|nr:energy-coupling factor transporter ATPase [Collibacillus ludicampi]GIM47414.1 energy-coupling factor transporter ATP-binding protein EcfA1 [Collibacillus ludicampi]